MCYYYFEGLFHHSVIITTTWYISTSRLTLVFLEIIANIHTFQTMLGMLWVCPYFSDNDVTVQTIQIFFYNFKSVQTFQTVLRLSRLCSDNVKNALTFQKMLIMLWVCPGFSDNAMNVHIVHSDCSCNIENVVSLFRLFRQC